jgi:hypothetical protein
LPFLFHERLNALAIENLPCLPDAVCGGDSFSHNPTLQAREKRRAGKKEKEK